MLFSRSRKLRQLGRLSLLPGLCNINEPLIFGVPLVMNPAFFIPFIMGPMIVATADYLLIASGWMSRVIFYPPFFIPAPISAYLATGGDTRAPLWIFLNMLILALVNYPFFRSFEASLLQKEKEALESGEAGGT
ncbi:MAG: PTS sugar transporter subunit IIC [Armatimonadetes bacterium]|nr:PTS sugar transporter subunit IIC [Armatimonadota bacterium]